MKKRVLLFFGLVVIPLIIIVGYVVMNNARQTTETQAQTAQTPTMTVVAKNLDTPWAMDFLPDGKIIFTEREGAVKVVDPANGQVTPILNVPGVVAQAESGLLGLVLHPQFATNKYVYIYYTTDGDNRVVRYTFDNNQMTNPTTIVQGIPASSYHNGGRIRFGPDGFLYITTGDAANESNSQNTNSLGGKILRVTDAGAPAPGNPFNNMVYSYGHRNPQGLAWDGNTLYATEHGPSQPSCCDELNKIEPGKNYGWPDLQGDATQDGMVANLINSGGDGNNTWAPSGTTFYNGSVFWAGLRGQALYEAKVEGNKATIVAQHFKNELGRIRDAVIGPDNKLYIMTTNLSAQGGSKQPEDDKIIKLDFGVTAQPTYACLGSCPTLGPTQAGISAAPTTPGGGTDGDVTPGTTEPTTNPCVNTNSVRVQTWGHDHEERDNGELSGLIEELLKLLKELLELIRQLLGGGSPTPTQPPQPTEPCPPTGGTEPTEGAQPTTGTAPTTGTNPTTGTTQPTTAPGTGTNPSGEAMPGDVAGWTQVFADDFNANIPVGAFSECNNNTDTPQATCEGLKPYPEYYANWWAYPNTWGDTAKTGADGNTGAPFGGTYHPEDTVSVSDGAMHIAMFRPAGGGDNHVATVVPRKCMSQQYGRYVERFKVVQADPGFKSAHLFYTGGFEIDYPENDYGETIYAFMHPGGESFSANTGWTEWHTSAIEWTGGSVKFFMDGKEIGTATNQVPNIPMSWTLQNESSILGPYAQPGAKAQLDIDWVTCYKQG